MEENFSKAAETVIEDGAENMDTDILMDDFPATADERVDQMPVISFPNFARRFFVSHGIVNSIEQEGDHGKE